jgi:hypothetical protein
VYKLPSTPPKLPFEVRGVADACTADARNAAAQSLGELQRHFTGGAPTPTWMITPHVATRGTWYELSPADPSVLAALLECGHLSTATADDLQQRGLDGKPVPEINYAPPLGLYFIRPRRPSPSPSP